MSSSENIDGRRVVDPTPRQAKDLGLVLVLPNRTAGAATSEFTTEENITLPSMPRYASLGLLRRGGEVRDAAKWIERLDIRPTDPERLYAFLSGGNQQKDDLRQVAEPGPEGHGDRRPDQRR